MAGSCKRELIGLSLSPLTTPTPPLAPMFPGTFFAADFFQSGQLTEDEREVSCPALLLMCARGSWKSVLGFYVLSAADSS